MFFLILSKGDPVVTATALAARPTTEEILGHPAATVHKPTTLHTVPMELLRIIGVSLVSMLP